MQIEEFKHQIYTHLLEILSIKPKNIAGISSDISTLYIKCKDGTEYALECFQSEQLENKPDNDEFFNNN